VRGWGGWRSVNDVIFPVLPSTPMKCRFCKAFDRNLGLDDDLCMEMDDHCGKCTPSKTSPLHFVSYITDKYRPLTTAKSNICRMKG